MAAIRVISRSCPVLSRGFAAPLVRQHVRFSTKAQFPRRLFASSARFQLDPVETPSVGVEVPLTETRSSDNGSTEDLSRTIAVIRLPKQAKLSHMKDMFEKLGLEVTRMKMPMDRFSMTNCSICFVELASKEQVQEATIKLHNKQVGDKVLSVQTINPTFTWDHQTQKYSRFFREDGDETRQAIRPLLEGRRGAIFAQGSGWNSPDDKAGVRKHKAMKIVERVFEKYGVEAIGPVTAVPLRQSDKRPILLCFLDFETQQGIQEAMRDVRNTVVEGVKMTVELCQLSPFRAGQLGHVSADGLKELQEKGLAPKETPPEQFKLFEEAWAAAGFGGK